MMMIARLNHTQSVTATIRTQLNAHITKLRKWVDMMNANPDEHLIEIVINDVMHGGVTVSDRFLWDICSPLAEADIFASTFCDDARLPREPFAKRIADEIRMQCYRYALTRAGTMTGAGCDTAVTSGSKHAKQLKRKFGVRKTKKDVERWTPNVSTIRTPSNALSPISDVNASPAL